MKNKRILCLTLAATLLALALVLQPTVSGYAGGGIIEVNTVDDNDDGVCNSSHCSLREAINWANTMAGTPTITFNIPGAGPHIIDLCHALPQLTSSGTTIDGTTEPSYSGTPVVVIHPAFLSNTPPPLTHVPACLPPSVGLWIETSDITIRGLSIIGFRQTWPAIAAGIVVNSGMNNTIEHNYIGLDASGAPDGNRDGILLGSEDHEIWTNAISANYYGIHILAGNQGIYDNRIGTNFAGDSSGPGMGNNIGIFIEEGADGVSVGSANPTHRNVISGNTGAGIGVDSDNNVIQGNHIGTNLIGDAALPNWQFGVALGGNNNLLGGTNAGEGNLISGNDLYGVAVGFSGHQILGNTIGADISGSPLGNHVGIFSIFSDNVIIGTNASTAGNLIAHNSSHGVMLLAKSETYHIAGNTITQNGGDGIILGKFSANPNLPQQITINRNSIFDNGGLGIDLFPGGVTPNDPGDADTGANTLLNFPELSQVTATDAQGVACTGCRVEAFIADGDPSGHGEGMTFVGEAFADSSGSFNLPLDVNLVSTCDLITTRATDGAGNSSEFSENMRVSPCFSLHRPWLIAPPILLGLLGLLGGRRAGRGRGKPGLAAAGGTALGAGIGGGLIVLAIVLPFVHIEKPQQDAGLPAVQLPCDRFLDPAQLSPADSSIFEIDNNGWDFTWSPSPEMPDGEFRWLVELLEPNGSIQQLTTTGNSLPFLSFDIEISQGAVFSWRLSAEQVIPGMDQWEPFCRQIGWRTFQFGERPPLNAPPWTPDEWSEPEDTPTPTPTPTETPTPTPEELVCVFEALQNSNCRLSDYMDSDYVDALLVGETAELIALNPEFTHGEFDLENGQCWILLALLEGPDNPYANCDVPVIDPPPPPTDTPTLLVCTPDLGREDCEASGGTWSGERVGSPGCICPE